MANLPETPQWEDGIYQIEVSDPVLGGPDGISNRQAKQLGSRTLYLKQQVEKGGLDLAKHIAAVDPHTQYALKASPTFTGTPTAPTPANNDNSKKLATTEFVSRIASEINEIVSDKLSQELNGADIPDPDVFIKNLGLGEGSALPVGVPVPWPSATPPDGWLKCNGATFNAALYPKLALAYPSGRLPDLRGEFIRGWDDGRGVDAGRGLFSAQGDAIRNITGAVNEVGGIIDTAIFRFRTANGVFGLAAQSVRNIYDNSGAYTTQNNPATGVNFDASRQVPTASENRPRNIAFNYIVRAA